MLAARGRSGCLVNCAIGLVRWLHLCSNGLLRHLKARNVTTVMWVVNHEEEFVELKTLYGENLMGVMTDYPTTLARFCDDVESGPLQYQK